mgnify:CR=1 FL=1
MRKIKINNKWYLEGEDIQLPNKWFGESTWNIMFIGRDACAVLGKGRKRKTITGSVIIDDYHEYNDNPTLVQSMEALDNILEMYSTSSSSPI